MLDGIVIRQIINRPCFGCGENIIFGGYMTKFCPSCRFDTRTEKRRLAARKHKKNLSTSLKKK